MINISSKKFQLDLKSILPEHLQPGKTPKKGTPKASPTALGTKRSSEKLDVKPEIDYYEVYAPRLNIIEDLKHKLDKDKKDFEFDDIFMDSLTAKPRPNPKNLG